MKNRLLIIILMISFLSSFDIYSQPMKRWVQIYDGRAKWWDYPTDMCKDNNGNYIVVGASVYSGSPFSDYETVLLKYDELGNNIWTATKNDRTSMNDEPSRIISDENSNLYCLGYYGFSKFLSKYDPNGNLIWFTTFHGNKRGNGGEDMALDKLRNIYVEYSIDQNAVVGKFDKNGKSIWVKTLDTFGAYTNAGPRNLIFNKNKDFYLLGNSGDYYTNSNFYIIKFDTSGNIERNSNYNNLSNNYYTFKMINDLQGNIVILAARIVGPNNHDIYVIKLSEEGKIIWEKPINWNGSDDDVPSDVVVDNKNNIIINGTVMKRFSNTQFTYEFITCKFDESGNIVFQNIYSENNTLSGSGNVLGIDKNNDIYSAGSISNDSINQLVIVKYDEKGNIIWNIKENEYNGRNTPVKMIVNDVDDFVLTADCFGTRSTDDIVTYRYKAAATPSGILDKTVPNSFSLSQNYPNPFNPSTTINYSISRTSLVTIEVYDVLGREVETLVNDVKPIGHYKIELNGSELASGIYFYQMRAGNFVETKKLILMK